MILPDRERRHLLQFHVLPRLGYRGRFLLAAALILGGLVAQVLLLLDAAWWLGLLAVLAGNLLLLVKGFDLRRTDPEITLGVGDWERTSLERFHEVQTLEDQIKGWDETFADVTSWTGGLTLVLLVLLPAAIVWVALMDSGWQNQPVANVFLVNVVVLALPHWLTGLRRKWRPVALRETVESLTAALETIQAYAGPPSQIQPLFQMSGSGEARVPTDARVFIRFPDGPEAFLGLQLQVSINAVQGTNYPYLYAVLVARDEFRLLADHLAMVQRAALGLTVESSREEGVEVIVVRQHTTRTSGYHTDAVTIGQIAQVAWESAAQIVGDPVG